jgi:hypothetical protein
VDARADVFSLGCLLVRIVEGHEAIEGESVLELLGNLGRGEFKTLPEHHPLASLVDDCLAMEPGDRPADAAAVVARVDGAPASGPSAAVTDPRRVWAVVAAAVAATGMAALVFGVAVAAVWMTLDADPSIDSPAGDAGACSLRGEARLGYARTGLTSMSPVGKPVELASPAAVLSDPEDPESVLCTLPTGSRVVVRERIRKGWLAVYADAVALP